MLAGLVADTAAFVCQGSSYLLSPESSSCLWFGSFSASVSTLVFFGASLMFVALMTFRDYARQRARRFLEETYERAKRNKDDELNSQKGSRRRSFVPHLHI